MNIMKTSSNKQMLESLEILKSIEKVQAPDALHGKLMESIINESVIAWWRVGAVAALLACLIAVELYVTSNTLTIEETAQMEKVVSIPDNSLYYE
ncbi:MAG: hypothetical protein ACI86C_001955 [Candidatus Latescibacterota bacterium]|jgi:hypothetical protein